MSRFCSRSATRLVMLPVVAFIFVSSLTINTASASRAFANSNDNVNNGEAEGRGTRARVTEGGSGGGGMMHRKFSREELVEAAARAGMEIVDTKEDWKHSSRRLAYQGGELCS